MHIYVHVWPFLVCLAACSVHCTLQTMAVLSYSLQTEAVPSAIGSMHSIESTASMDCMYCLEAKTSGNRGTNHLHRTQ